MGMDLELVESLEDDLHVIATVQNALKAAILGDREDYDQIVTLMDPSININPNDADSLESKEDRQALLVVTLRALSEVVSHIDVVHHQSLYTSVLGMSIWKCQPIVRAALLDLVVSLAASSGIYLDACLDMLVCHFKPPPTDIRGWRSRENDVVNCILSALQHIADMVPLAPMRLLPIIERRMPQKYAPATMIEMYVSCMLKLETSAIGEFIGSSLLKSVVDRLLDLDVDIRWEDILQNDCNRGIFDMELEDMEDDAGIPGEIKEAPCKTKDPLSGNSVAETLDNLMTVTCQHLASCANDGRLSKVFETLLESFQKTVLMAYKSKFVQFVMFYACSLDPEICGVKFPRRLLYIFLSKTEPPLFRISAVSYLASYLSRAKFLPCSSITSALESLVNWCFEYCRSFDGCEKAANIGTHQVFYSGCQAVMYILCFHMRSIIDDPSLKDLLVHLPLEPIFCHSLDPLKVCLPSIVEEFLRQAKAASLFTTATTFCFDSLLESELSKSFGGLERLDMFLPFDPYLLKESDRFIRPNFKFWSMVRTTYDNCYSEDEDPDEVHEDNERRASVKYDLADDMGSSDGDGHSELGSEDDLGYSMNQMSITPKRPFIHHAAGNDTSRMPAKIRPSVSPDW